MVTISENEKRHAASCRLQNYQVSLINKYSDELKTLTHQYDIIVDNNLFSYACCKRHYHDMIEQYCELLKPGGLVLTDDMGMDWKYQEPDVKLIYEDLVSLEGRFPLTVSKITAHVYSLTRLTTVSR